MRHIDLLVAFIIRETGWTLEYVRNLPLEDLFLLANEFTELKKGEDYQQAYNFASMIATMVNLWSKNRIKPEDIVGYPPEHNKIKEEKEEDIWKIAEKHGIQIPKG